MPDSPFSSIASSPAISPLTTQTDKFLHHPVNQVTENNRIEKAAKDFESILLGSWLQKAEESFASLPGGDDDEDADAGKEQLQSIAMQSLGASMTAAGGIGIAKMISRQLHKADNEAAAKDASNHQASAAIPVHKTASPSKQKQTDHQPLWVP
jgi:Rod binding domain-containing protein